jgi:hypothetical protein
MYIPRWVDFVLNCFLIVALLSIALHLWISRHH